MKDQPKKKSVLLFSGGMDSYIISHLEKIDMAIYFKHGQKYQKQELSSLQLLDFEGLLPCELIIEESLQLGRFERDDAIIPLRNLLFLSIGTYYGENLYIGSVYGDRTLDKSLEFFNKSESMFNFLYQDQWWCTERKFNILAPYKNFTKTELVKHYLDRGFSEEGLLLSYSCYEGEEKPCGICKSCLRKWVALKNNSIDIGGYFKFDPISSPLLSEIVPLIIENKWRGREDIDFKRALGL